MLIALQCNGNWGQSANCSKHDMRWCVDFRASLTWWRINCWMEVLSPSLSFSTRRRDSTRRPLVNFLEKGED